MKRCSTCKIEKEECDFGKDSTKKDGLRHVCKLCTKKYHKQYNKDHYVYSTNIRPIGKWSKLNPEIRKEIRLKHYSENKDSINAKKRAWRETHSKENAFQQRKDALKRIYGLTLDQYNDMLKNQNNKCAICDREFDLDKFKPHVDHSHINKKVRALLCIFCNHALGNLNDDINLFNKAINYLNFHSNNK